MHWSSDKPKCTIGQSINSVCPLWVLITMVTLIAAKNEDLIYSFHALLHFIYPTTFGDMFYHFSYLPHNKTEVRKVN